MSAMTLETVLRRDRVIVAAALILIALFSWVYLAVLIAQLNHGVSIMSDVAHPHFDIVDMLMSGISMLATPQIAMLSMLTSLWLVTLIGLMTSSASPMILLYARMVRQAAAKGRPFATTSWFAAGYLLVWLGFSVCMATVQIWLQQQTLFAPAMDSTNRAFAGLLLLAAGLFQWGPLKDACLGDHRMPARFIQRHGGFRPEARHALHLGVLHGSYCVACCWALMALLFVGGVMNMFWVAGLSILVLLEKMMPLGRNVARYAGVALFTAGGWMLIA